MTQQALVLLGVRGAGKDTLCKEFQKRSNLGEVRNCKFSELTKSLTAAAFGVCGEELEDKIKREQPVCEELFGKLSLLDLLDSLFFASELDRPSCRRLAEANRLYTLRSAKASGASLLVFTDIRRGAEAEEVLRHFPTTAVCLHRHSTKAAASDVNLQETVRLLAPHHLRILRQDTPETTYNKLKEILQCNP